MTFTLALSLLSTAVVLYAQEYPQWRGPQRDGSASGFVAPVRWPENLVRRWSVEVGEGYSTPIVVGETIYAFSRQQDFEILRALDASTGAERWRSEYSAPFTLSDPIKAHGAGPKATPLFYRGKVYTLGISGIVSAFDAKTGKRVWQTAEPKEQPFFSAASSPIGYDSLVIAYPGNYEALTAFDAETGKVHWVAGDPGADGVWEAVVGPLAPNLYSYAFMIDGVRTPDPVCRCTFVQAGRFSDSRLTIPATPPRPWEAQNKPPGTVHRERFFSARHKRIRSFVVYTPPGYSASATPFPVLFLLPGTPGDENDWTSGGGFVEVMLDNLIAEGTMVPAVVVMHASDVLDPPDERRGDENLFAREAVILNEVVPAVRQRYRVSSDSRQWAIAGLSLGGEFGMYVGLNHPDVFRSVASISGSFVPPSFDKRFGPALATGAACKAPGPRDTDSSRSRSAGFPNPFATRTDRHTCDRCRNASWRERPRHALLRHRPT